MNIIISNTNPIETPAPLEKVSNAPLRIGTQEAPANIRNFNDDSPKNLNKASGNNTTIICA